MIDYHFYCPECDAALTRCDVDMTYDRHGEELLSVTCLECDADCVDYEQQDWLHNEETDYHFLGCTEDLIDGNWQPVIYTTGERGTSTKDYYAAKLELKAMCDALPLEAKRKASRADLDAWMRAQT